MKGIIEIILLKQKGSIINDIKNGTDRIGWVISQGENVKEAITACEEAMEIIKIVINPVLK